MGAPSNAIKSCWWWNWEASTLSALSGRKTMRSDTEPTEQGLACVMVVEFLIAIGQSNLIIQKMGFDLVLRH